MDQMRNRYFVDKGSASNSKLLGEVVRYLVIPLTPELNTSAQRCLTRFLLEILFL
jgi:hypothetical protein